MNKSDLAPIRERLETLKRTQEHQPEASEPLWEHFRSPELPPTQQARTAANQTQQAAVVQALQQRSQQAHPQPNPIPGQFNNEATSGNTPAIPPEVNMHWQRLQQEAIAINELAQKQVIAIQDFKRTADRLAWSLRRHPSAYGFEFEQFCELQHPGVVQVMQDEQGRLVLSTTAVDLYADERHASQTAEEIRAFSQARSQGSHESTAGFLPPMRDPMSVLENLWHTLTNTLEGRSRLTPLDIVIWLGGGLIGRLALQLLLAALPGIWPWLVGATVGAVALALYRLLLMPRPDIAFVARLFLALVGLALGGQL